jgi:hypothetical protein
VINISHKQTIKNKIMKTLFVKIMLLPVSLLAACTGKNAKVISIPGTYVNHAQSPYSIADDTLQISQDAADGNSYHISRKTGSAE